jgi:hypothetical protein
MQNFGRGMWRRVGDYERIQVPKNVQLYNYLAFLQEQKIKQRQHTNLTESSKYFVKNIQHNDRQANFVVEPEEIVVEPEEIVVEPEEIVVESEEIVVEPEKIVVESEEIVVEPEEIVVEPGKYNNINQTYITQEELVSDKLHMNIHKKGRKKHKK